MNREKIKSFVINQLKTGLSVEDITIQLRTAKWSDADIEAAFAAAKAELTPTPETATVQPEAKTDTSVSHDMEALLREETSNNEVPAHAGTVPPIQPGARAVLPPPSGRGAFKTGLKLFTQSIRIMRNNPGLLRYASMSTAWTLLIVIVIAATAIIDSSGSGIFFHDTVDSDGSSSLEPTFYGFVLLAVTAYLLGVIVAFYGVATSSHALAIFRGEPGDYKEHIGKARKKLPAILVFVLINTVVGYILNLLETRFRLIGWIISRILGALWRLSTSFVLPVIADSDDSGTKAISSSIALFKNNWGETITGRVAAGGAVMLLYFLVGIPVSIVLFFIFAVAFGAIGMLIALALLILGFLLLAVIASLADSIVTTSLYYYAKYRAIPPSYSPELLGDVFTEKKSK